MKEQIAGQRSIKDVFQKAIEKEGEKKKNEEDDERRKEKDEGKTPPEVITIHSSSASDDAKRMDDSASSPLGGQNVDSVKTPSATMELRKEEEDTKKKPAEEEKKGGEKRKKAGVVATKTKTSAEEMVMSSPDSAEKKRAERGKKAKGDDDDDDDDDDDSDFEMMVYPEKELGMAGSKSGVSKTPAKSAASATAVAPKTKIEKPPTAKTMELKKKGWDREQTSALFDCVITTLYSHFRTAIEAATATATGGNLDQKAIEKYSRRDKSEESLMPSVKKESLNNPLTRERMFHSPSAIEDKWKNVMVAVNTAEWKEKLASRIFATSTKDGVENTDDMEKLIECITMMNVFDCFLSGTDLSEKAPLKGLFEGNEESALKSLAERAKAYDARKYDDWWDQVPVEENVYKILNQPYARGLTTNASGYKASASESLMMKTFVRAAVHEESQRENMVNVFSDAKKAVQQYSGAKEESEDRKAPLRDEAIELKKECMKYVFNAYEKEAGNVENARKELNRLAENPDADVGDSVTEKAFNDWVDMNVMRLWEHWALGGEEENDEENEKLNEFFKNYVEMRETNPPSSDEE